MIRIPFLAAALLVAAAAAACGDDPTATPATPATTPTATTPAPSATPAPAGDFVTTASGLQYRDTVVGSGPQPKAGDCIAVAYSGRLADGTEFDASTPGRPVGFYIGVQNVIAGWDEGVLAMKVGGERTLVIPPDLGYGAGGYPPIIPPNATLTFDVKLVAIRNQNNGQFCQR